MQSSLKLIFKPLKCTVAFCKWFTFFLLVTASCKNVSAQVQYEFNKPGNECYFQYLSFAPDGNYQNRKRPYLLVIGKEGESAQNIFSNDTLKNIPKFHQYMLFYLPNKGGATFDKTKCWPALLSLITSNFKYGTANLFLCIYDNKIQEEELKALQISEYFKSISYSKNNNDIKDITEKFKESVIVEMPKKAIDEMGTYYTEVVQEENEFKEEKPCKKYFGPPATFNYTLSGIVKDKSTGEALPSTTIQIKGTSTGTSTNADGYFTLIKVPTDTTTLVVSYIGYQKTEVYLTPQSSKKNLIIELSQISATLQTITVTGQKEEVVIASKEEVGMVKMTPKKIEQLPNLGEKDIMRSMQLMPGISASQESSTGLYVRGGTPDQNLVLYDGFTVYQVDHLYGFFSAFNSNAIKDIQLYKGGFESKFGGRLSSVTELTGKDGNQKKINIGADLSLLSINSFVEIPVGQKFTSIISFRRSYKGPLYNKIFKNFNSNTSTTMQGGGEGGKRFSQTTTVTSYFYDLNGKFTYRPTADDVISLSLFNGTDKLDNSFSSQAPSFGQSNSNFSMSSTDLTKYGNIGGSLKWSRKWHPKLYGNTILSYSNFFSDRDKSQERTMIDTAGNSSTNKNGVFENNDLKDYSLKSDYNLDILNHSKFQFGGFATYYNISYNYAQSDTASILDKVNKAMLRGAYIQNRTKLLNEKLQITSGIRLNNFSATNQFYFEPRLSVTFLATKEISLKASTGKYYQFINRVMREDIMSGSKEFWMLSDGKSVPISSAIHYIAGISFEKEQYLLSAEAYYKTINNLTEYSLRFNPSPNGVSYNENFYSGQGYAKGIEFLIQKKSGNLNGWISYTLGEAKNKFSVYGNEYYAANQDVRHELKIVSLYKYKRWDFSATWIYASGRPYTAPSGAYNITLLDNNEQDFYTVTSKNSLRLPAYHRCDFAINYLLLGGNKGDIKRREIGYIGFSLFNVYNRKNVWYKQYNIEDGQIIETNVNYLGITPNITLSLKLR